MPDSYPQSSSRPHTGVCPSTGFVRFLQDSCQCPLLSHEFCKNIIWLCSSIGAAFFAPSRWPITTWFYWSFNRRNQIQLPIYVYLLHINEKEEKHFLMGSWLWYPRISFHFQLGILLLHLTLKEETYSWKSVQKHNFLFYIPTWWPQFILGFWIEMFSCRVGEYQLIFGIRRSKGQIQPSMAEIDCKGNFLLNNFLWVWKNFWSGIECSVPWPILEAEMSLDCIMTPFAFSASLPLKTLGRAGEILNNRLNFSFRLIKNYI